MTQPPKDPAVQSDELQDKIGHYIDKCWDEATHGNHSRESVVERLTFASMDFIQANYTPKLKVANPPQLESPAMQGDNHLAYMIDSFAQAIINLGKEETQAKDKQEPTVDHIQAGLHAELVRKDLEDAIQAQLDAAYQRGRQTNVRTLETISSLLNGDDNQVEVVRSYLRNALKMYSDKHSEEAKRHG